MPGLEHLHHRLLHGVALDVGLLDVADAVVGAPVHLDVEAVRLVDDRVAVHLDLRAREAPADDIAALAGHDAVAFVWRLESTSPPSARPTMSSATFTALR